MYSTVIWMDTTLVLRLTISILLLKFIHNCNSTRWPAGKYGLLKPKTGCPQDWIKPGWIYQDTEDTNPSNDRSEILHIDGYVDPSYVVRSFCLKTKSAGSKWPEGQYCIYNLYFNGCPSNEMMRAGQIRWDDEDTDNTNAFKEPLPYYNNHRNNTRLSFCCITNGSKTIPIDLPTTNPFYLMPFKSIDCQQVKWMISNSEWIKYDKENTGTDYSSIDGVVPYHTLNSNNDITNFYCYYQSCNYTLHSSNGSFQSPRYPRKYPDGQICSWKIKVPTNHTVKITFNTFSLNRINTNDSLNYYIKEDKNNGTFLFLVGFHGDGLPPVLTSNSSEVMFVFQSDAVNSSTGFQAMYTISQDSLYVPEFTTTPTMTKSMTITKSKQYSTAKSRLCVNEENCNESTSIVVIVVPLACFAAVVAVIIDIAYRCRTSQKNCTCENQEEVRCNDDLAVNPIYDCEIPVDGQDNSRDSKHEDIYHYVSQNSLQDHLNDYKSLQGVKNSASNHGCEGPEEPEYHELEPIHYDNTNSSDELQP